MKFIAGLLLLSSCLPAHQQSQADAARAPDQDQFDEWSQSQGVQTDYTQFLAMLEDRGVDEVVEPWQLLRQGTDWKAVGHPPFAMPPRKQWESIIPTLVFIREQIEPRIGPVEVVSCFRTEEFNAAAGGSSGSRHKFFEAVDLVPRNPIRRNKLLDQLEELYAEQGESNQLGLGLYANTRFHIDTWKARRW